MKKIVASLILLTIIFSCQKKSAIETYDEPSIENNSNKLENETQISNLDGIYKYENDDESQNITLTITNKGKAFFYNLKTSVRNVNGKISITPDEESTGFYLILEGIEWDEYRGDISDELEEDENDTLNEPKDELPIPVGIDTYYNKNSSNELIIQNGGNSMNYYIKLGECGEKYIHLIKQ